MPGQLLSVISPPTDTRSYPYFTAGHGKYTHKIALETLAKQEVMNLIQTNLICFNNVMFITLECLSIVNQNVTDKFPTATMTNL